MEGLELFGLLLVIIGIIGLTVMLKGKRPTYKSMTKHEQSK